MKDEFMRRIFANTSLLWAYEAINPICGAAKADIWRYAVLYLYGGVYIDDDSDLIAPLNDVIKPTDRLVVSYEKNGFNGNRCYIPTHHLSDFFAFKNERYHALLRRHNDFEYVILNWLIMSEPRHPIMERVLRNLVEVFLSVANSMDLFSLSPPNFADTAGRVHPRAGDAVTQHRVRLGGDNVCDGSFAALCDDARVRTSP